MRNNCNSPLVSKHSELSNSKQNRQQVFQRKSDGVLFISHSGIWKKLMISMIFLLFLSSVNAQMIFYERYTNFRGWKNTGVKVADWEADLAGFNASAGDYDERADRSPLNMYIHPNRNNTGTWWIHAAANTHHTIERWYVRVQFTSKALSKKVMSMNESHLVIEGDKPVFTSSSNSNRDFLIRGFKEMNLQTQITNSASDLTFNDSQIKFVHGNKTHLQLDSYFRVGMPLHGVSGKVKIHDHRGIDLLADYRNLSNVNGIMISPRAQNRIDFRGTTHFANGMFLANNLSVAGNLALTAADKMITNGNIQIKHDQITADHLPNNAMPLNLTDQNAINISSGTVNLGTESSGETTVLSKDLRILSDVYGKENTATGKRSINFKDAVYVDSPGGLTVSSVVKTQDIDITPGFMPTPPDYVFLSDYKLMSLEEVDQFIQEHGHLPEVPSAKTIEEEGYSSVDMDFTLLKKIEELTLHTIELEKELNKVEQVEAQNEVLLKLIHQLQSKLDDLSN